MQQIYWLKLNISSNQLPQGATLVGQNDSSLIGGFQHSV